MSRWPPTNWIRGRSGRQPSAHFCSDFMSDLVSSRISCGSSLRCQQSAPRGEQIRKRRQHPYMMSVLEQSAEANLTEAKYALDRPENMFHPCANLRLQSVRLADPLVDATVAPIGLVGQILCHRCYTRQDISLASIGLIAPHPRLFSVQQVRQRFLVSDIGCRDLYRVNDLRSAVDANVYFHAEIPLLALLDLVHLRVAIPVLVLRRARGVDNRRIHDRAIAHFDATRGQMSVNDLQYTGAHVVLFQQMPELADRGLIRRGLGAKVHAHKAAHRV